MAIWKVRAYLRRIKNDVESDFTGAAGLAGIIKTTMAIEKAKIPPQMHFENPNPDILFDEWRLRVPTSEVDWPSHPNGPRRASVSSFGFGGANAHVILESYEEFCHENSTDIASSNLQILSTGRPYLFPITTHSTGSGNITRDVLNNYINSHQTTLLRDLAISLSSRRSMHRVRSFAIGHDIESLMTDLTQPRPIATWVTTQPKVPRLGFVFTGQGAQTFDMGFQLIKHSPPFRATLSRLENTLQGLSDGPSWSIIDELMKSKDDSRLAETEISQPICTAIQIAIVDLLQQWGVEPVAVCGHSSGEIAAAYCAGILSQESAIVAAYYRGLYMSNIVNHQIKGGMIAVGLSEDAVAVELEPFQGRLCLAAVNSPSSVTVSGDLDAVEDLYKILSGKGTFARTLRVTQAFHSHHMNALAPAYQRALEASPLFKIREPKCRMFSSVTSQLVRPERMGPEYWVENMIRPVRFSAALTGTLIDEGENQLVDVLIEIGPHDVLKGPSRQVSSILNLKVSYLGTLIRGRPAYESVLETAGQLFAMGYPLDLPAVNRDYHLVKGNLRQIVDARRLEDLPSYSWSHKNYWNPATRQFRNSRSIPFRHTLLGLTVPTSTSRAVTWRNYLRLSELPWLADHTIEGTVIFPGMGYISLAVEAAVRQRNYPSSISRILLRDIDIKSALTLLDNEIGTEVLLDIRPATTSSKSFSDDWLEFNISSYDSEENLTEHCHGYVSVEFGELSALTTVGSYPTIDEMKQKSLSRISAERLYSHLQNLGITYGDTFKLVHGLSDSSPGLAVGSLKFQPSLYTSQGLDEHTIAPPALLDGVLHFSWMSRSVLEAEATNIAVPRFIKSVQISGRMVTPPLDDDVQTYTVRALCKRPNLRTMINQLVMTDQNGEVLVEFVDQEGTILASEQSEVQKRMLFFQQRWQPCFDLLSSMPEVQRDISNLISLVNLYLFQHPTARVMQYCSSAADAQHLLNALEIAGSRYKSFRIVCQDPDEQQKLEILEANFSGLVIAGETENEIDLIILADSYQSTNSDYIEAMGEKTYLIIASQMSCPDNFEKVVSLGEGGVFRKTPAPPEPRNITVIVDSTQPSSMSPEIVRELRKSAQILEIFALELSTIKPSDIKTDDVVVLASLDVDMDSSEKFNSFRNVLTEEDKNMVWVLNGAFLDASNPEKAKFAGLLRTTRNENILSRFVTLDVNDQSPPGSIALRVLDVLDKSLAEDELVERGGFVFIQRLDEDIESNRRVRNGNGSEPRLQALAEQPPVTLVMDSIGRLDTLYFGPNSDLLNKPLGPDEVEVQVLASALNFRDVAIAMGFIQDWRFGEECAGIITKTGSDIDISRFKAGDRVLMCADMSISNVARNKARHVRKIPDHVSFVVAASFITVTMTALYSLLDVGRLQPGETVLIHSAAGGVGQMAIQIAQQLGAKVLATCSEGKREFLHRQFGLQDSEIFSSRNDSFQQGVFQATNGRGVDVVLNSLAGKLLEATWQCIAPFGRFVEIGKRDIHQNSNLSMDVFSRNVSFSSVDMLVVMGRNESLSQRLMDDACQKVFSGEIKVPETLLEMSFGDVEQAFRLLQQGKHIGKIILVPQPDDKIMVAPQTYSLTSGLFKEEKTYLLVGGLGGLGTAIAEWMYMRGARRFAFFTVSGVVNGVLRPNATNTVEWLRSKNCNVTVYQADVANLEEVEKAIASIGESLAGILHLAMVLADTSIQAMTYEQWQTALRAKCEGAWNLHSTTLDHHLDFFTCFSSISTVLGNPGQGNYSAANAYLDGFMSWRRGKGLVGTSMNIAAVASVGVAAEKGHSFDETIALHELLYLVEEAIQSDLNFEPKAGGELPLCKKLITGINTSALTEEGMVRSALRHVCANRQLKTSNKAANQSLARALASLTNPEEYSNLLSIGFIDKTSAILGVAVDSIDSNNALAAYGLDSIVAIELRKWLKDMTKVDIPLFELLGSRTIKLHIAKIVSTITSASQTSDQNPVESERKKSNGVHPTSTATNLKSDIIPRGQKIVSVPISGLQKRIYALHQMYEEKWRLNTSCVMHFTTDKEDSGGFLQSITHTGRRHAVLNTAFLSRDGVVEQKIMPNLEYNFLFSDLSTCEFPEDALETLMLQRRRETLDIENGEVWTTTIAKMPGQSYMCMFVCHHLVTDEQSCAVLIQDWADIFSTINSGQDPSTLPTPKIDYIDYTLWHNELLQSETMKKHQDWWISNLKNALPTSVTLPFAKGLRPSTFMVDQKKYSTTIPANYVRRMKRICTQLNVVPFHFMFAAFRAYIFRHTGEDDMTLLMANDSRPNVDCDNVVGLFTNAVPLRLAAELKSMTINDLAKMAAKVTNEALAHNIVPYQHIVDLVGAEMKPGCTPIAQVAINYHTTDRASKPRMRHAELTQVELIGMHTYSWDYRLEVFNRDEDSLMELQLHHSLALYAEEDMKSFLEGFADFLISSIRNDHQLIVEMSIGNGGRHKLNGHKADKVDSCKVNGVHKDVPV